jgi:hypothetical protein
LEESNEISCGKSDRGIFKKITASLSRETEINRKESQDIRLEDPNFEHPKIRILCLLTYWQHIKENQLNIKREYKN